MSQLSEALAGQHWNGLLANRGEQVTVTGADGLLLSDIDAVPGFLAIPSFDGAGAYTTLEVYDWLFLAADWPRLPLRRDRISWCNEYTETDLEFDVGPDGQERHYRYSDPLQIILRVHTSWMPMES